MNKINFRSSCGISSGLDLFGDKWSLLIIRDLLQYEVRTFKDFAEAGEKISSARLSDRLQKLEKWEVITKEKHPTNKKVFLYKLTQKGKDLSPVVAELLKWSYKYLNFHISENSKKMAKNLNRV